MPKKQPKPKAKAGPQFDADPLDEEEQPPFTLDDDGNMVLRRSAAKVKPTPSQAKRQGGKRGR